MENAPLRVVLAGCGGMARNWIRIALEAPTIDLVGLTDVRREAAEGAAEQFDLPKDVVFDSLEAAVKATGAQAVFDVTVPAAHDKVTLEALRLGCHVLGEKPMSDTIEKARRMVAAAEEADRLYAVTQTRRPIPNAMAAANAIRDGIIGTVQEIHSDFYVGARFGAGDKADDFRGKMADILLVDMAIHTFDNARQLSGADPVGVYCHSWNPPRSWYEGDASACAIFEMTLPHGSPVVYTYRGSWCNEGEQTTWEGDWRVAGQKGTLHWNGGEVLEAEVVEDESDSGFMRKLSKVDVPRLDLPYKGHEFLIREFADCVLAGTGFQKGRQPQCPCDDNIKSFAMVAAAVESAHTGKRVEVAW